MNFKHFDRNGPDQVEKLEVDGTVDTRRGTSYLVSELLEHAINTTLALGRPLLVSGEPGCGKTELGFAIARKLGLEKLRFFSVKSTSESQRLFYEYDTIRHFHTAQSAPKNDDGRTAVDPRNFICYQALGQAILDASNTEDVRELLPVIHKSPDRPLRSVVVIDEIDKAPRDFPNDLLNEIDQLWFRVPELAGWAKNPETPRAKIPPELRPIIIITSNLERQLPDAFLRRCVFHHIEHPDDEMLRTIALNHLQRDSLKLADRDLSRTIELVDWARRQGLDKPPGLAELLEFTRAMGLRDEEFAKLEFNQKAQASLSALAKTTRDLEILRGHLT